MATSGTLVVVFVCAIAATCLGTIPDGYVLQVMPNCGTGIEEDASIHLITDLNLNAKAVCAHGIVVDFNTADGVNFDLSLSYPMEGSQQCVFVKRANSLVFTVKVVASYGEKGSLLHQKEEEYTVSCTFDPKGVDSSTDQNIVEGLIAPTLIASNMGEDSDSTFTLDLVNVLGDSLSATNVQLGKTVMLRAVTSGAEGLRPISCDVIHGSARYAIIRAGCGDGMVFAKDVGFRTKGNTTTSPYFQAFSINAQDMVRFECNFITCALNTCDGSSCGKCRDTVLIYGGMNTTGITLRCPVRAVTLDINATAEVEFDADNKRLLFSQLGNVYYVNYGESNQIPVGTDDGVVFGIAVGGPDLYFYAGNDLHKSDQGTHTILVTNAQNGDNGFGRLAYNPFDRFIYFCDNPGYNFIGRVSVDGNNLETHYINTTAAVTSISIHVSEQNIYYCLATSQVYVQDLVGGIARLLIQLNAVAFDMYIHQHSLYVQLYGKDLEERSLADGELVRSIQVSPEGYNNIAAFCKWVI